MDMSQKATKPSGNGSNFPSIVPGEGVECPNCGDMVSDRLAPVILMYDPEIIQEADLAPIRDSYPHVHFVRFNPFGRGEDTEFVPPPIQVIPLY